MAQTFSIPGGRDKGVPLEQADTRSIEYWVARIAGDLERDPKKKFAERDREWLAAARALLQARKNGTAQAPKPASAAAAESQTQAIQRAQQFAGAIARPSSGGGTVSLEQAAHDPAAITARLAELAQSFHVVSPVTSIDALPPGCGVSITYVSVDPNPDPKNGPKEVYDVGGRLGLSGDTLNRIAGAAALDWDPSQTGRLDDGSDPHYVHFRAVGHVRNFDGSIRTVTGEVEIDAREGSPQLAEIREKAEARAKKEGKPNDGGESQIRELRKFILRHAESKAKNRAIACMGVKRSYAPAELQKPFAVARLVWTGQTDDPELRREFARMHAERMMDGAAALYGRRAPLPPARPAPSLPVPSFRGHAPPPVGTSASDDYDTGADYEVPGEAVPDSRPAPQAAAAPAPVAADDGDIDRGDSPEAY